MIIKARNFIRAGENNNRVPRFLMYHVPCFQSIIHETCLFLAFSPEQLCSDLSRQIKKFAFVLKVLTVKFQASTLDQCHHLLINLSCKTLVNLSMPNVALLSKKSSRPPLRLRLYCIYTLRIYTNTARSTEAEQRLLTSETGLLQNFRGYKKWIPLSSSFWAINSRL